ncbi:MAG: hypothetical protein RLZZ299_2561 [Pseudomonadota bacterium]|jgi:hypothetical protein
MNPIGGLPGLVGSLLDLAGVHPAPWVGSVGVLVVAGLAWPLVRRNLRTDRARRALVASGRAPSTERARLRDQAFAEVAGDRQGLLGVAAWARDHGDREVLARAVEALSVLPGTALDVARLRRSLDPNPPATPLEARLRAERLLAAGLRDPASAVMASARARWPHDPELREDVGVVDASGGVAGGGTPRPMETGDEHA